jgi:predicted nucleic-acid-binding Zn-ribbon protein
MKRTINGNNIRIDEIECLRCTYNEVYKSDFHTVIKQRGGETFVTITDEV